jgi:hypothetical protein
MLAGCSLFNGASATPAVWHVDLHGEGVVGLRVTVVDRSSLVTSAEAVQVPAMHQMTPDERARLETDRALVVARPDADPGFLLLWAFDACRLDQSVAIAGTVTTLAITVDQGPQSCPDSQAMGLAAELRVGTSRMVAIESIVAIELAPAASSP